MPCSLHLGGHLGGYIEGNMSKKQIFIDKKVAYYYFDKDIVRENTCC